MKEKISRMKKNDIEFYDKIILTQPLAHGLNMQRIYERQGDKWKVSYASTSIHHICPYDGVFRDCKDCGARDEDFDVQTCLKRIKYVGTKNLMGWIKDCERAGLEVEYIVD